MSSENIKIKLIADVAVLAEGDVLMVKYKDQNKYDHQTGWFLPDDLLKDFEHPDKAAIRILHEQLKISTKDVMLNHIESFRGNDKSWHLVFHYKTSFSEAPDVIQSEDIEFYDWFDLNNLPDKNEVAHHGWALYTLQEVLKNESESK